jgi:hypothetical protein
MWVMKGRRYLGQVKDGIFHDFRKKNEERIVSIAFAFGSTFSYSLVLLPFW